VIKIRYKNASSLLRLAAPLIVNNLAIAGIQFSDAVMSGRLGSRELAAVAVGGSIWFLIFQIYNGLMMAISPIAARLYGAKQAALIGRYTRQAICLSIIVGIIVIFLAQIYVFKIMDIIGIDIEFRHLVTDYLRAIVFGAPGIFSFLVLRYTTEGIGFTRPVMYSSLIALVSNVFFNYMFMFGNFGAPALGVFGCGVASALSMWIVFCYLSFYIFSNDRYKELDIFTRMTAFRLSVMREILKLGIPISITITAEAGLFSAVSIMIGTLGTQITGAHQIALNVVTTMFMVPLGISAAITVKVGQALGSNDPKLARLSGSTGIIVCGFFMLLSACSLLLFRQYIVNIYTTDAQIMEMAMSLLLVAAIFQIVDGIQIAAAGALRGYKDTKIPMIINLIAYWMLAFPLSYMVGIVYELPPTFIWGGFVLGLSVAAILLTWRFSLVSKKYLGQHNMQPRWN
jgi:MATE family multidrug resistance protein